MCNESDGQSIMFALELCISVELDDYIYYILRSKSDSEILQYKPRSSNFQSVNKFQQIFDLSDTDIVQDSPMSFANQSNSSLQFNELEFSDGNNRNNCDLRPLPSKTLVSFHPITFLSG